MLRTTEADRLAGVAGTSLSARTLADRLQTGVRYEAAQSLLAKGRRITEIESVHSRLQGLVGTSPAPASQSVAGPFRVANSSLSTNGVHLRPRSGQKTDQKSLHVKPCM
jgi:hypothetical protein